MTYDVIVRNGLWFDGTGARPQRRTLGIRDGIVAAVSAEPLDETGCPDVIDADGKWVLPGFIDVHTHYDAEVLLDPGLRESVRHGVTTRAARQLLAVDGLRRLRGRRRPVQPRRGGAAQVRARRAGGQEDVDDARRIRPDARRPAARAECQFHARPFGPAHLGARTRPRHHRGRPTRPMPNSSGWPNCSTRRSTRACSACPAWTRRSTSSTATASGHAHCRRPSPPGANAAG